METQTRAEIVHAWKLAVTSGNDDLAKELKDKLKKMPAEVIKDITKIPDVTKDMEDKKHIAVESEIVPVVEVTPVVVVPITNETPDVPVNVGDVVARGRGRPRINREVVINLPSGVEFTVKSVVESSGVCGPIVNAFINQQILSGKVVVLRTQSSGGRGKPARILKVVEIPAN